jgi:hypothetical protein
LRGRGDEGGPREAEDFARRGNLTTDSAARGETTIAFDQVVPVQSKLELKTEVGLDMDGKRLSQLSTTKSIVSSVETP